MADPLGLIGSAGLSPSQIQRPTIKGPGGQVSGEAPGQSFTDVLLANLNEVNRAQQDATQAVNDLSTGKRSDLEGVITATHKADNAFRMLQALRNKVIDAYEEIKQVRT